MHSVAILKDRHSSFQDRSQLLNSKTLSDRYREAGGVLLATKNAARLGITLTRDDTIAQSSLEIFRLTKYLVTMRVKTAMKLVTIRNQLKMLTSNPRVSGVAVLGAVDDIVLIFTNFYQRVCILRVFIKKRRPKGDFQSYV